MTWRVKPGSALERFLSTDSRYHGDFEKVEPAPLREDVEKALEAIEAEINSPTAYMGTRIRKHISTIRAALASPTTAEVGILPMFLDDGSRTICDGISGGADEVDGMPRTVTLSHIDADGRATTRRYEQSPPANLCEHHVDRKDCPECGPHNSTRELLETATTVRNIIAGSPRRNAPYPMRAAQIDEDLYQRFFAAIEALRAALASPQPASDPLTKEQKRKTGLIEKYRRIERADGQSASGEKHDGCEYFVLDLTHDRHAMPALRAYANSCAEELPILAADLRQKIPAVLGDPPASGVLLSDELVARILVMVADELDAESEGSAD